MITSNLLADLKAILPVDQVEEKGSQSDLLGNSGEIVVYPKTEQEIESVLKYANDNGKKVTIAGMGTKRGFGGLDPQTDILLSLEMYKGVNEHTVGDMTLTVKTGTTFKELQEYLAQHQQMIALDPAWPEHATIGGIIAANDSGPKRLGYGSARDLVIGLRVVYPDGNVIRSGGKVVKNVAGYDMNKLFIGSMGTLGVISEVTLKLRPIPKYQSLVLLSFPDGDLKKVRAFAIQLLDSMMEPIALELLNPSISKALTGNENYTLAISFEDVQSSVLYQEEFVKQNQPANTNLQILAEKEAQSIWDDFYKLAPNGLNTQQGEITEAALKIGVKNLDVLQVIKASQLLEEANNLTVFAHGGLGHGLCQVILKGASEDVMSAIESLKQSVKELGGYVVVKHLPLSLRQTTNVWGEKPAHFFLLDGIKTKVDPKRTLNHKRFVGGI
ncbi:FAD-binding oxidoreductase [Halalkalibacter nanhaiisediminis]|uniref:Glycolate oxidase FAD binding subunit n=1 Tax=Halalkalibacter nanhaiisediminis TaxID=688079 RepID=A0A562QET8_9BACI|nr:FAD-binding oxidoreductase [Halalkalibacter nanhaiisediminis]TWI55251.1 glycolate oxidase FAD binding subunit [Halalkalibacter nanhaiisediminis]